MSRRPEPCWWCDAEFATAHESIMHNPCPKAPPRGSGELTRPVSCPRCAGPVDLRAGPTCPGCGHEYPVAGFAPDVL